MDNIFPNPLDSKYWQTGKNTMAIRKAYAHGIKKDSAKCRIIPTKNMEANIWNVFEIFMDPNLNYNENYVR